MFTYYYVLLLCEFHVVVSDLMFNAINCVRVRSHACLCACVHVLLATVKLGNSVSRNEKIGSILALLCSSVCLSVRGITFLLT